jgi:hypothetical protein
LVARSQEFLIPIPGWDRSPNQLPSEYSLLGSLYLSAPSVALDNPRWH